jgi:hypothetical protein
MNLKTELLVMGDGPSTLDPVKVVEDAKKGIDYYADHPGFKELPRIVKYDITALMGKPIIPCEGFLCSPRSTYGGLTRIVEEVSRYAESRGFRTDVIVQPLYKDRYQEPSF